MGLRPRGGAEPQWRNVAFLVSLFLLVDHSIGSEEICDLPGMTMEYGNVKVDGTYRMKLLQNGPKQSPKGTCSIYCKKDRNLYFKDDEGREKGVTANNLAAPVNVKGSYGELLRLSRTTKTMASYLTMGDSSEEVESKIGHESSTGTGVFGGGSGYALSIGTSSDHGISFHTSGKASPRLFIGAEGKVGLGRIAKTNTLEVNGEASKTTAGSWLSNSDARIKERVETIVPEEALGKILALRPVSYAYIEAYAERYPEVRRRDKWVNFIAQEYAEVFPEAVMRTGEGISSKEGDVIADEILQVDVHDVNIHLVAALQAQQQQIEGLRERVSDLERIDRR
ncbi:hypothetical protein A3770_01p07030 [Chloropicon primus]|uniref:Peptidase S74 domain-containing protein n=1 Tax=Chloropicon primus TaxID=1764295 RepID=A0A5B8MET0_9CHLO|nr:hypothetical protein A3770_01p07030 [Chloropicon primus]|eukprot:QDZ18185.1 hypothetical protein A3770_01p07030 [Chloropicon primus]